MYVKKKEGKLVKAYQLGDQNPVINGLMEEGKLRLLEDGRYAVMSLEATKGEVAEAGDYIKIDSSGLPYPNKREYFLAHHISKGEDTYEQIPEELYAWTLGQPHSDAVDFLMAHKGLAVHPENPERYYSAPLWGDTEIAAQDAVIVFYEISYGEDGKITDASFNFVKKDIFDLTYDVIS